jgi:hypothetical protein
MYTIKTSLLASQTLEMLWTPVGTSPDPEVSGSRRMVSGVPDVRGIWEAAATGGIDMDTITEDGKEYVELDYEEILDSTDEAIWFQFADEDKWIPRSQIMGDPDEDDNKVWITVWMAEQKGLV